ncbi:LysR family transcriptional regulator [Halovulum sp. GXIMD14794]
MTVSAEFMTSRLKMRHMSLLVAISDCGTLLRAAERVAISQPGATKALQEIEKAFGQQLFERTNRGLEPNDIGLCAIRYARLICTDLVNLGNEIEEIWKGSGGRLAIGSIMGAVPLSSNLISTLVCKLPNLKVQFTEGTSSELLQMLDEGRLDFVICRTSVSSRPEDYEAIEVRKESISVVANRSHPLANHVGIDLQDLHQFPWIVCLPNMPMRRHFEREFANQSVPEPRSLIETASALSVLRLMQGNPQLCSMQADDVIDELIGCGDLCRLNVRLTSTGEPYYLVTRRDRELSSTAKLAVDEMKFMRASKEIPVPA